MGQDGPGRGNRTQWGTGCAHVGDGGHGVLPMPPRVVMARCPKALVMGGCPQWPGARTACGTWTETGHGILASTASSSPSAVARATSGTAAETLCACSPSASSATALPSGPEIPLCSYPPAAPPAPFPMDPKAGPMPPQPGFPPMAMSPSPSPAVQYPMYPSGPPAYNPTGEHRGGNGVPPYSRGGPVE
ncbi:PREDICTED: protein shisa-4 [Corvus brachyrhynchos]|uniref:protein shisa-4 n=1 Tax=Corvus brachyrhynchos TaxID=85066 RepID=UPI0008165433|nr:PREDICTED: protein shisa-4 [Corvus brachyrhynchos]